MDLEHTYFCKTYEAQPAVLERGEGIYVWDVEGRRYIDAVCGVGACNQGHCHPKVVKAFVDQAAQITLTSRAFHNT